MRLEQHGNGVTHSRRLPLHRDTLFDCASLTKPLITAALVRALGADLDRPVRFERGMSPFPLGNPTIRQLMEHTGGMPGWCPVYTLAPDPGNALRRLPSLQHARPGAGTEYSCTGYILLGRWLELETGHSLPELAERHLFRPLGVMARAYFPLPAGFPRERVAATELGNRIERDMSGNRAPHRASPIWGEVHDGNAQFLGGAAGNAGLFATVESVAVLARAAWVDRDGVQTSGNFRMGFKNGGDGTCFPRGTLGHTGFTGTSVCLHLRKRNKISILLTNRLHRRKPQDILPLRARFHAWAEGQG